MAIRMDAQYNKLRAIALEAKRLLWNGGDDYLGPVAPQGITIQTDCRNHGIHFWFVLADNVPPQHMGEVWDEESPAGVILAKLDNNFEFSDWNAGSQILGGITGDSSPGTITEYCDKYVANPNAKVSHSLLYSDRQGSGLTHLLMGKK